MGSHPHRSRSSPCPTALIPVLVHTTVASGYGATVLWRLRMQGFSSLLWSWRRRDGKPPRKVKSVLQVLEESPKDLVAVFERLDSVLKR